VKVSVDGQRCQGHTLCAMIAPESFELDDVDGHASAVNDIVPPDQEAAVREAVQSCPEQAIVIE
jgi:ferredoxin